MLILDSKHNEVLVRIVFYLIKTKKCVGYLDIFYKRLHAPLLGAITTSHEKYLLQDILSFIF